MAYWLDVSSGIGLNLSLLITKEWVIDEIIKTNIILHMCTLAA